jgi:cytidine deaminase
MEPLTEAALLARLKAYTPYSHYQVGAALLSSDGSVWTGCNVENVSFSLCICAERTALVKMVSEGQQKWTRLAVVTKDGGTPCGACLQMLSEFASEDAEVVVIDEAGQARVFKFTELLPFGFASKEV